MYVGRLLTDTTLPMIGIQDLESHLHRRKNWNRGMSQVAVKEYEQLISRRARQLVARLEKQHDDVILGDWFSYFSYVYASITPLDYC